MSRASAIFLTAVTVAATVAFTGGGALAENPQPVTLPAAGVSLSVPASWDSFRVSGGSFDPKPRACADSAVAAYQGFIAAGLQFVAIPRPCSKLPIGSLTVFAAAAADATLATVEQRLRVQYKNARAHVVSSERVTVGDVPGLKTIGRVGKGQRALRTEQLDMLRNGWLVTVSISVPNPSAAVADRVISSVATLPSP